LAFVSARFLISALIFSIQACFQLLDL